jgi:hypothetical protein
MWLGLIVIEKVREEGSKKRNTLNTEGYAIANANEHERITLGVPIGTSLAIIYNRSLTERAEKLRFVGVRTRPLTRSIRKEPRY